MADYTSSQNILHLRSSFIGNALLMMFPAEVFPFRKISFSQHCTKISFANFPIFFLSSEARNQLESVGRESGM